MEITKAITLVLADDHGIVREGIAAFCNARSDLKILGQSSDGAEAVELILALKPDLIGLEDNFRTVYVVGCFHPPSLSVPFDPTLSSKNNRGTLGSCRSELKGHEA